MITRRGFLARVGGAVGLSAAFSTVAFLLAALGAARTSLPRFDVVSVKPSPPGEVVMPSREMPLPQGGYWSVHLWNVARLVVNAYQLGPNLVVGLPSSTDRYDIEARMPPDTTTKQFRLMLQALLADRFQMRSHTELRPTDVIVMTADQPGPELHRAAGNCAPSVQPPPHPCGYVRPMPTSKSTDAEYAGYSVSMADVANFFTAATSWPIVDETGLTGLYDFDITFPYPVREPDQSDDDYAFEGKSAWETAFRKQLGLKIALTKPDKRPFPVLVIDHIAPASAN